MNTPNGYTVIVSEVLPAGTMVVSSDIYALLKETPEQTAARTKAYGENMEAILGTLTKLKMSV